MRYRLVAADLDGTLLDSESRIQERTVGSVRDFRAHGGYFVIASGRAESTMRPYAEQLGLDEPIIAFNGGKLASLKTGESIYETFLGAEKGICAYHALRALGKVIVVYHEGRPYSAEMNPIVERYRKRIKMEVGFFGDAREVVNEATKKLLVIDPSREFKRMIDVLRPIYGDDLNCVNSEDEYFEVLPPGTSKGHALLIAAEWLGVPMREVVAVGDHLNDISMIEAAGVGVAVANAAPATLDAADYVTESNDDDGVGKLLRRIMGDEPLR